MNSATVKQEPGTHKKCHQYKQRFKNSWLSGEFSPWLSRNPQDTDRPFCLCCQRKLEGGIAHIRRHAASINHKKRAEGIDGHNIDSKLDFGPHLDSENSLHVDEDHGFKESIKKKSYVSADNINLEDSAHDSYLGQHQLNIDEGNGFEESTKKKNYAPGNRINIEDSSHDSYLGQHQLNVNEADDFNESIKKKNYVADNNMHIEDPPHDSYLGQQLNINESHEFKESVKKKSYVSANNINLEDSAHDSFIGQQQLDINEGNCFKESIKKKSYASDHNIQVEDSSHHQISINQISVSQSYLTFNDAAVSQQGCSSFPPTSSIDIIEQQGCSSFPPTSSINGVEHIEMQSLQHAPLSYHNINVTPGESLVQTAGAWQHENHEPIIFGVSF